MSSWEYNKIQELEEEKLRITIQKEELICLLNIEIAELKRKNAELVIKNENMWNIFVKR